VNAADTPQPREVSQHKAQIATWLALPTGKLLASAAARGPRLPARPLSRAPGSSDTVTPTLALRGRPPSVGAGKDVFDVVVDQHNVEFAALLAVVGSEVRVTFPLNPIGGLFLAQEHEVVELGGMVAISIGWQPDRDFGGYGQPLDDTAIVVMRNANDHGDSSF
jgi:hypothetical protein